MISAIAICLLATTSNAEWLTTQVQPLSGMGEAGESAVHWDFRLDKGRGSGVWTKIRVPAVWEQEGFGDYLYGTAVRGKQDDDAAIPRERGVYRTTFEVPEHHRDSHIRLVFGGVMTDATVLINGETAGAVHRGGFYQFDYDVTSKIRAGQANTLEVIVDKESADASVNRAERRGDYWTFGGIFRPVWLEYRPREHIERVAINATADGSFSAQLYLSAPAATEQRRARVHLRNSQGKQVASSQWLILPAGGEQIVLRENVPMPKLWTAETPHLYNAHFELETRNGNKPWRRTHELHQRFGFRTFEVRQGEGLFLNGRRIILKGVNRHSFLPRSGRTLTRQDNQRDVQLMKEANLNAVRMSHYPPDKSFLDAADEAGLYVVNELAGWQGAYDRDVGAQLIGELVRRDVNHPSILFWANGNEGGWEAANDAEFDRWDPQRRPVLHPWAINSGINTDHYETYDSTARLNVGEHIFMPTEFLHALHDGGGGAGLQDYWEVMRSGPHPAGGFIWAWRDEGIERTDHGGRIDNHGNAAADGVIAPHGQKEGSYYAIKEIWSPVQLHDVRIEGSKIHLGVENRYDFLSLTTTRFRWRTVRLPLAKEWLQKPIEIGRGEVQGPSIDAGDRRNWSIALPATALVRATHVYVEAVDAAGRELWTWSAAAPSIGDASNAESSGSLACAHPARSASDFEIAFDDGTGWVTEASYKGSVYPLSGGPRLVAFRRDDLTYVPVEADAVRLKSFQRLTSDPHGKIAVAKYSGILREVTWSIVDGCLRLDYELAPNDTFDLLGVAFDVPEEWVASKRWLGNGPYRVWQNRTVGGSLGVHENAFGEDIPGLSYAYPEFKGYFSDWSWLALSGKDGRSILASNESRIRFVGVYAPTGGEQLPVFPTTGWSFLHVIPAMANKFKKPTDLGPSSQPQLISSPVRGRIAFSFTTWQR
jgi:hypothetical protein